MSDIIIPFYGNHADIPSGWSRYTALDDKFPKASGAESAEATGGASTHSHTSTAHSHSINSHTHSFTTGASTGGTGSTADGNDGADKNHTHSGTSGAPIGGTTNTTAVTYGSVSNNPPYVEVIFIKSSQKVVPNNGLLLWDQASAPSNSNYKVADGNNSTVNLNNKYLKGAATSGNAGATGGSTTNTHDISHTHTTNTHTHASVASGGANSVTGDTSASSGLNATDHTHTASFGAATMPIDSYSGSLVTAETVEPAYKMLMAYQNKAGAALSIPINGIAMTIEANVPAGWYLCDGNNGTPNLTDKYIKITTSSGNIGNTGGANTHTHAAQSHTHTTSSGHTHSVSYSTYQDNRKANVGSGAQDVAQDHTHAGSTSNSTTSGYASANTSADSSSNEPEYVVVKYIQKKANAGGSTLLALMCK